MPRLNAQTIIIAALGAFVLYMLWKRNQTSVQVPVIPATPTAAMATAPTVTAVPARLTGTALLSVR